MNLSLEEIKCYYGLVLQKVNDEKTSDEEHTIEDDMRQQITYKYIFEEVNGMHGQPEETMEKLQDPLHRKERWRLWILVRINFGATSAEISYVGKDCMIDFIMVKHRENFKALMVQLESLASNFKRSSPQTTKRRGLEVRETPRYLDEGELFLNPQRWEIWIWMDEGVLRKNIYDFP